jgi:MFS family permease
MGGVFIVAELALILRVPLPSLVPWCVVSVMGAATVLSYAMIADYFPQGLAARANGALNLAHFGAAFAVQYGIGLVVGHWAPQDGHYPVMAYQFAFGLSAALQAAALLWFAVPWLRTLSRYLYAPFTWPSEEREGQTEFVTVLVEGPILEAREAAEW